MGFEGATSFKKIRVNIIFVIIFLKVIIFVILTVSLKNIRIFCYNMEEQNIYYLYL